MWKVVRVFKKHKNELLYGQIVENLVLVDSNSYVMKFLVMVLSMIIGKDAWYWDR